MFLVELDALIMVASTLVPVLIVNPLSLEMPVHLLEQPRPQINLLRRWRNLHTVVSSGTGSRLRSIPTKLRMAAESCRASPSAESDRLNQCCRK